MAALMLLSIDNLCILQDNIDTLVQQLSVSVALHQVMVGNYE